MAGRRKFSKAFKSQAVEEFLAGEVTQAQLARRYGISDHLIIQWRKRYAEGKLEQIAGASAKDERIKELERMVGRLTMENELLKKGVRFALARESERSSIISGPTSNRSSGVSSDGYPSQYVLLRVSDGRSQA
jgi:transposase